MTELVLGIALGGVLGFSSGVVWTVRRMPTLLARMAHNQLHDLAVRVSQERGR